MEEVVEYGFSDIEIPKTEFMAKFNPETGAVISVGPAIAFENEVNKVPIDEEIALRIIEGTMLLSNCVVNIDENQVEISEVKSLFKIDDVLHRVIEQKFFDSDQIDVFVSYSKNGKFFKFSLAESLGGKYKNPPNPTAKKNRKTIWGGETLMQFYITDYNDPNILYKVIDVSLDDLKGKDFKVACKEPIPGRFSVYTRRLFKNYVLGIK